MALEALGVASSVIAVVEISGRIAAICFQYSKGVKNAKEEVNRLLREVSSLCDTTSGVQDLLEGPSGTKLKTSKRLLVAVEEAQAHLRKLDGELRPSSTQKAFRRLGIGALKWPLKSKDVEKVVQQLGRCGQNISLALQVDNTTILLDLDQKAVLSRLPIAAGATHESFSEESNSICMENTRVSLLDLITQWADDPYAEPLFWLSGMAGTGKSTIARTVARNLARTGHLGASFFFKRGEADRDGFHKLFTTLAAQLAARVPGTASHMKEAIDADPTLFQKAMPEQFDKLIVQPLSKVDLGSRKLPTLVILIDALDECGGSQGEIRRAINLFARVDSIKTLRVHVLITSRPELPIRIGFGLANTMHRSVALQEIPEYVIQHDISIFLEHQLARIRTEYNVTVSDDRRLPLTWPGHEKIQKLTAMAAPLFIFAATVCRYVADVRWHPDDQLTKVLRYQTRSQQSKLDATYRPVLDPLIEGLDKLEKVEILQQFHVIVGSIIILAQPLSIPSLAKILHIPQRSIENHLDGLHSVLSVPKGSDAPVRLLHLSFRDFLLDPNKEDDNPFWVNETKTHAMMASNSLRLMNNCLRQDICDLRDPGTLQSSIDPHIVNQYIPDDLQYACANWVLHLQLSKSTISDDDDIHAFLKIHFLHWIEALSLMGRVRETIDMMKILKDLASNESSGALQALIEDARRILLTYMPIISLHPLQLYSSVLLFAPERSIIRNHFHRSIPEWICSRPEARPDWNNCLQVLEGHTHHVRSAKFSPSGGRLVSSSSDKTVRIWNTNNGNCLEVMECSTAATNASFSHDEKRLLVAYDDGMIRIWDVDTGECIREIRGHTKTVRSASFSNDSKLVISSSENLVRIWDAFTGDCTMEFAGHTTGLVSACISPDGTLVAHTSRNGTIRICHMMSGECEHVLEGHALPVSACAFSHDGSMLVSGSPDESTRVWCVRTGKCKQVLYGHGDQVCGVKFSHDSSLVVSTGYSNHVKIYRTATGECVQTLDGHSYWNWDVDFSPNSEMIASASADRTIRLWQTSTSEDKTEMYGDHIDKVAISFDLKQFVTMSFDEKILVWSLETNRCIKILENHTGLRKRALYSPNSAFLATSSDSNIWLWDTATWTCSCHFKIVPKKGVEVLSFSADSTILMAAWDAGAARIWDIYAKEMIWEVEPFQVSTHSLLRIAVLSSDSKIFFRAWRNEMQLWKPLINQCIRAIDPVGDEGQRVWAAEFSSDSKLLGVAVDKSILILDSYSGETVICLDTDSVADRLIFSPRLPMVLAVSQGGAIRVWNIETGQCVKRIDTGCSFDAASLFWGTDHLQTNLGRVLLGTLDDSSASTSTEVEIPQDGGVGAYSRWITWNGKKFVWLPSEFVDQPAVVLGNKVALCSSATAKVYFVGFTAEEFPK